MTTTPAFCWQSKAALRQIRESVHDYGSALAVYVALSVVASDKQAEAFTTTHQWLASLSGFGVSTVKLRLKELERIGLVKITTPPIKAPCTYSLLAIASERRTLANGCRTLASTAAPPLATSEEQKKRKKKQEAKKPTRTEPSRNSSVQPIPLECL